MRADDPLRPDGEGHGAAGPHRIRATLIWLALAFTAGRFLILVIRHVAFAGFLEPLEADVLHHIQLVTRGLPPYPPAGPDFIGCTLMPLYYYVSAPLFRLFGDCFAGPRVVSSAAALGSAGILAWLAWKETREVWPAALAAALFCSSYRLMDACLTCAQPDALMLLLILSGYASWIHGTRRFHEVLALLLLGLAAWTKLQGALHLFGVAGLGLALRPARKALPVGLVAGLCLALGPLAYLLLTPALGQGFVTDTVLTPLHWQRGLHFAGLRTAAVLVCFVPFAAWLSAEYVLGSRRRLEEEPKGDADSKSRLRIIGLLLLNLLICAGTMTVSGSSNNHYVPFISVLCLTSALGAHALCRRGCTRARLLSMGIPLVGLLASPFLLRGHAAEVCPTGARLMVAGAFALAALAGLRLPAPRRGLVAALFLAGAQIAAGHFRLDRYLPAPGFEVARRDLSAELNGLRGEVVWWPYGNVPRCLTGRQLAAAPSDLVIDDVTRQLGAGEEPARELQPFRERLAHARGLYLLSNSPLEDSADPELFRGRFRLVTDYGPRFQDLRQAAVHWFGGGGYPRYLYTTSK